MDIIISYTMYIFKSQDSVPIRFIHLKKIYLMKLSGIFTTFKRTNTEFLKSY